MQIVLRDMLAADLDRVTAILAGWNMAPVPTGPGFPNSELPGIPIDTTIVALADGEIVGVGSYVVDGDARGRTVILAVDPRHRKAGIGTQLQTARLGRMKALGVATVITDADRPETIDWYVNHFGCRVVGTKPKKHPFGLGGVVNWTVLELDLRTWSPKEIQR